MGMQNETIVCTGRLYLVIWQHCHLTAPFTQFLRFLTMQKDIFARKFVTSIRKNAT
jgi:hypothetical protein